MTHPIVLLGAAAPWLDLAATGLTVQHEPSPDALTTEACAVLIHADGPERLLDWACSLRADERYSALPLLSVTPLGDHPWLAQILDGQWESPAALLRLLEQHAQRRQQFRLNHLDPALQAVLAWLWIRDGARLRPVQDWHAPQLYRYPVLECIAGSNDGAWLLLRRLAGRKLLAPDALVDRVRTCPDCHSGQLSYVDLCPGCHSLRIEQQPSIHCFTCGHVAPQGQFRRHGVLECPNCSTRLRHIGSDYDRPMENHHCHDCQTLFIEPDIRARCLACNESHAPDALAIERVHDYQLSEDGRLLCRHGELLGDMEALVALGGTTPPDVFRFNLAWLDKLCVRYPQQGYSLLAVRLSNIAQMVESRGFHATSAVLAELERRMRAQLRDTDLVTRYAEDTYLLLLPNTPPSGVTTLRAKVDAVRRDSEQPGMPALAVEMASYSSGQPHAQQDVSTLIDTLVNEVRD